MEITKDDLKTMQHEIIETLDQRIDDKLRINNDILRQEIRASETRVIASVAELLSENVLPQIDELDRRVTKLEVELATNC